ncbi:MAG: outer membrane beta-barrel protein [Saprospiraceae bacterium]|nr:outer membrane beta-barrel protein [Saprospiraceae bacterium]
MSKFLSTCFSILFISHIALAQNFEIGLTVGALTYNGDIDIVAKNVGSATNAAFGLVGKYRLSNSLLVRGQILRGKLSGSEKTHPTAWRQERGLSFTSPLTEISGLLEWEFLSRGNFTAYAFGGASLSFFNPKTDFNMPNKYIDDVNPDANVNYRKFTATVPVGMGLKYSLPHNFFISAEMGARFAFSDYLDGISQVGNPNRKDTYIYTGLAITKAFGGGKSGANRAFKQGDANCPKF